MSVNMILVGSTSSIVELLAALCLAAALLFPVVTRLAQGSHNLWKKIRIQKLMKQQGVDGLPLTFTTLLIGHGPEMLASKKMAMKNDLPAGSHHVERRTHLFISKYRKLYGDPFLFWWGVDAAITTRDVDLVKAVLSTKFTSFVPSKQLKKNRERMFGKTGLLTQDGDIWAHHRRLLMPAFQIGKLKDMVGTTNICVTKLIEEWEKRILEAGGGSVEIDACNDLSSMVADVLARAAFGSSYAVGQEIFRLNTELSIWMNNDSYYSALPLYRYLPTKRNKRIAEIQRALIDCLREGIQERMQLGVSVAPEEDDLLGLIVKAGLQCNTPGGVKAMDYAMDECRTFYFAGHESTNLCLQWTVMLMSLHPEWQEKARLEVDEVTQGKTKLTNEMVNKLKVVTMVLQESLRLYSPSTNIVREAVEDVQVGDLLIPKGVCVHFSILGMHTLPELWGEDALQFNPERFKDGVKGACKNIAAYMPFAGGPRICLGQAFAMLQMKTILARILQSFRFSLSPAYRHTPYASILLRPQYGMPLIVSKRLHTSQETTPASQESM